MWGLDRLRKKTMRGLEGQKLRGFSTGENVYGYKSQPVGELRINKKGQPKYDGMVQKIYHEEADVVKWIYDEFIQGKSISKIVQELNNKKTPTRKRLSGGWNTSTVSRILKNEKYTGKWVWRKGKNVRDPMTGRMKVVPRAEKEWLSFFREDLVIIDEELWGKAQKRWEAVAGAFPIKKSAKSGKKQKSYVHSSPTHLLAGLMKCDACGGAIVLISGKGSGYYGCYNAKRKTCENKLLVPRKRVEKVIISELRAKILTGQNLEYVYKKLEKVVQKGLNRVPEDMKRKKGEYDKVMREVQNYLNYIKAGNFSNAVSEALSAAEARGDMLECEVKSLEFQRGHAFKSPPKEWVDNRLERFYETLEKNTTASALALKGVLGEIRMEAVTEEVFDPETIIRGGDPSTRPSASLRMTRGEASDSLRMTKPYYVAHTKIQTLALLDDENKGSNWYQWRRRRDSNPGSREGQRFSRPPH